MASPADGSELKRQVLRKILNFSEKFFVEKNPTSLPQQWQEVGVPAWSNNAIIKIFENENDFLKGKT